MEYEGSAPELFCSTAPVVAVAAIFVMVDVPAPTKTAWLVKPVKATVRVLTAPDVAILPDPIMFQFPAVGDKAPPESPVIVCATPEPFKETKPLASTVNLAESK